MAKPIGKSLKFKAAQRITRRAKFIVNQQIKRRDNIMKLKLIQKQKLQWLILNLAILDAVESERIQVNRIFLGNEIEAIQGLMKLQEAVCF
ncbi:hypothetical protein TNIN_487741 [Trichonephila inaurata madagascariensis]|uniref:Uncharacterized protein n=1 Tax=Trichonephila inaurata madagascariensis TaxID=2747483 RepID=A0A8X6YU64_9ARAC|nr:hypothetical protein TNIN_487741 [Trichonephila inaurata madagascariensis]